MKAPNDEHVFVMNVFTVDQMDLGPRNFSIFSSIFASFINVSWRCLIRYSRSKSH